MWLYLCMDQVREHIPLEQGLRPDYSLLVPTFQFVREHIPLEQGLRLCEWFSFALLSSGQRAYSIRTRIKTYVEHVLEKKQVGQRAYSIRTRIKTANAVLSLNAASLFVREHIPLEQGLRHLFNPLSSYFYLRCQRAYSIRTRIKTITF